MQAHFEELRPAPCNGGQVTDPTRCESATSGQSAVLYIGLYLIALGAGGVRAALPALGADQFDPKDPEEAPKLSNFFNWFFFSLTTGAIVGVTLIVWVGENKGWDLAFGISALAVLLAVSVLILGKRFYRITAPAGSPFVRIAQVLVAAMRNRHLETPKPEDALYEKEGINGEILKRTNQFRFLDKAAVPSSANKEQAYNSTDPWRLCTTTQVEETKILIRMLPIILSTIFLNTCLAQLQTFTTQQGNTMDRELGEFKVPASSVPVLPLLFIFLMIPLYDRVFVPFARGITGVPSGVRHLQRIGVGLVLSMEFFYSESSAGMKALATGISMCSSSFGYFLSSVVVEVVNRLSGGWLESNNLNRVKLHYFYWLLAGLSVVNLGVYLVCASWYKYKEVEDQEEVEMVVA
ncbi:unnamed protein product [Linum tenue]|uniref:Uncharacterized protein n=1 Tax=Linum tenue TaxID=586396 RepID=A0AAV0RPV5_9ROSI|nr:unnamed protein product [Linum tenue]